MESIARSFTQGGPFMWPILASLGLALAVIAERIHFYFLTCGDDAAELVAAATRALQEGRPEVAVRLVSRRGAPLNVILQVALKRYGEGCSMTEIRQRVDETTIREVPRMTSRLGYLPTIANVAALGGLLGTTFGVQQALHTLAIADCVKASELAAGISPAMNTTSFGLMVAIPCLAAHCWLTSLQGRRAEDLDRGAMRLMSYLENRLGASEDRPRSHGAGHRTRSS